MRKAELTRTQFIAWLGEQTKDRTFSVPPDGMKSRGEITLVWLGEYDGEAPIIAVDAAEIRDFLAFVATYVGTYVPFTAFFRVAARQVVDMLPAHQSQWSAACVEAFIGVMICEAAVQIGGSPPKVSEISLQACLATPSAVAATAALLGFPNDLARVALQRWFSIREEFSNGHLRIGPELLNLFWSTAFAALSPNDSEASNGNEQLVVDFVSAVFRNGSATDQDWQRIARGVPGVQNFASALKSNREDRVRVLDQFIINLRPSSSRLGNEVILGYLAAQVAEGSLNYIPLASRVADQFPLSVLWFGFFSGLNRNSDVMTAGECLGRRIERRIKPRDGLGPIRSDLSYEEFTLFLQEGRIGKLRTDSQSVIEVELIPGVTGRFRHNRNLRTSEDLHRNTILLESVRKISGQLQAVLRDAEMDQNRELFDDRDQRLANPKHLGPSRRRK